MTPEELQEVVAAVIAALKTNGKTIDQLTAVTSLADTDNLEISNGKKVSFGKLKELVAAAVTVSAEEIKGWEMIESTDDLPEDPTQAQQEKAYVIADTSTMYVYVGYGGDTLDGLYQSLNMKGEDGAPGPPGADGHDGVDLGEVALVNNLTEGGEGSALSAEMGKILKDELDNYVELSITMTSGKILRRGGTPTSDSNNSISNYIDIKGFSKLKVTTALRRENNQVLDTIVGVYDKDLQFLRVAIDPRNHTSISGTINITDAEFAPQSGDAYLMVCNRNDGTVTPKVKAYKGIGETYELLDRNIHCVIDRPMTTWQSYQSGSRMWQVIPLYNFSGNIKLTLTLTDSTNYKCAVVLATTNSYAGASQSVVDTGWQGGLEDFVIDTSAAPFLHVRIRGYSTTPDDSTVNALIDDFTIEHVDPLFHNDGNLVNDAYVDKISRKAAKQEISNLSFDSPQIVQIHEVKGVNHRGYNVTAPENTMPAFKLSAERGFSFVETDVQFTSDDVAVLLHDASINRTARNADGTEISGTVNIADITYADALTYDFGVYKSASYAGTTIPTLAEFLLFCRNASLHPYIEIKDACTEAQARQVAEVVSLYGMCGKVSYISFSLTLLTAITGVDTKSRFGYVRSSALTDWEIAKLQVLQDMVAVFVSSSLSTTDEINKCIAVGIPYELWTVDDQQTIINANPYISGFTSNLLNATEILRANALS